MNKNKKVLALGSSATLIASAILGVVPAQAAVTMTLAPSAGSGYSTLSSSTFTLAAGFPTTVNADTDALLKYRIQNSSASTSYGYDFVVKSGGTTGDQEADQYGSTTNAIGGGGTSSVGSNVAEDINDDDFVIVPSGNAVGTIGANPTIEISLVAGDQLANSGSLNVTAWLDLDGDNRIDENEDSSPTRTVSFVRNSTVVASIGSITAVRGATTLGATVSLPSDFNVRQIDEGDLAVRFGTVSGSTFTQLPSYADSASTPTGTGTTLVTAITSAASWVNSVAWVSATSEYKAVFTPYSVVSAGTAWAGVGASETYAAQLMITNNTSNTVTNTTTYSYADEGTFLSASATSADDVEDILGVMTGTAVAKNITNLEVDTDTDTDDLATSQAGRGDIKKGANGATLSVYFGDGTATTSKPVSKQSVRVVATPSNITISDGITAGGKAVNDIDGAVTFYLTTDSAGYISVPITATSGDSGDELSFAFTADDITSAAYVVHWEDPTYSVKLAKDHAENGYAAMVAGGTLTLDYVMVNQWGGSPTDSAYSLNLSVSNANRTTANTGTGTAAVVAGKATISYKDNGAGTGSFTLTATAIETADATSDATLSTLVNVIADVTPASVTPTALTTSSYGSKQYSDLNLDGDTADTDEVDNRTKLVLETKAFGTYDALIATPAQTAPSVVDGNKVVLAGTVKNAAGVAIPGAQVTLAANGFLFKAGSSFVENSITFLADSAGGYSVSVWSQVGGAQSVKVTAGAATANYALTYAAGTATVKTFTITVPSASQSGRTVDVLVTAKDKFGNAAQGAAVTLSSTGPGYLINTSGSTLADGTFSTKLLVGSSDRGTASIKVSFTIDGVITTQTATVSIGAAEATANIGSFSGRVAVRVENAKGSTISVKVGKQWYKYSALNDNYLQSWKSRKGTTVAVSVYVDGELQNVQTITVK